MVFIDLFDEIKSTLDLKYVVEFYGVQLNSKNYALCPFHQERTPSFKLNTAENFFYCFGCAEGGSVIDFVMKMFNLNNLEAARKLDTDFNLNLSGRKPTNFSLKSVAKMKKDRALVEEFEQWEKQAFATMVNYFKALRFWGEMLYVRHIEYFDKYSEDIQNIVLVESIVDIMIENTNNFEEQIKFYKNYGKLVQEIENRRTS